MGDEMISLEGGPGATLTWLSDLKQCALATQQSDVSVDYREPEFMQQPAA